jgi:predicted transcriptional regulator
MVEVNLRLDEELAERARRIAEQRHTTVDAIVGQCLAQLPGDGVERAAATDQLIATLRQLSRPMGGKHWKNRDELYER